MWGRGRGLGSTAILVFSSCVLSPPPPPPISGQSLSSLASELEQSRGGALCCGEPPEVPCSIEKPRGSQRLRAGRDLKREQGRGGWVCASLLLPMPILRSLFCLQWSQAAPMAEGEQKPHEGKSPPPTPTPAHGWGGGPLIPQGMGGKAQFLRRSVGVWVGKGHRNLGI